MKRKSISLSVLILFFFLSIIYCKSTAFTSAKLYLQQENYAKAIEFLELEISQNKQNAEAYYLLGRAYGRESRFSEMNDQFELSLKISEKFKGDIIAIQKKYWIEHFNLGIKKLKNELPNEAINNFKTAIVINPNESNNFKYLAYCYSKLNNSNYAIDNFLKAIELTPNDTQTMFSLGIEYYNTKQYQECIELMNNIIKIDPKDKDAVLYLALSHDHLGNGDKALEAYVSALKENPNDADLYFNRGRLFYIKDDLEKAAEDFKKVLRTKPSDLETIINLGEIYLRMGDKLQQEIKRLGEEQRDPSEISELHKKEMAYYKKTKILFEQIIPQNPESYNFWYNLGVVYVRLGLPNEGNKAFKQAEQFNKSK